MACGCTWSLGSFRDKGAAFRRRFANGLTVFDTWLRQEEMWLQNVHLSQTWAWTKTSWVGDLAYRYFHFESTVLCLDLLDQGLLLGWAAASNYTYLTWWKTHDWIFSLATRLKFWWFTCRWDTQTPVILPHVWRIFLRYPPPLHGKAHLDLSTHRLVHDVRTLDEQVVECSRRLRNKKWL